MRYRTLGRTGLEVSEIGFGAWGIGGAQWLGAEDRESLRALEVARSHGINVFDTALAYGEGHSERLIGEAFKSDARAIIATKVPPKNRVWPAKKGNPLTEVFPKRYVLDCLDQSLKNLAREHVDLLQFHVWNDDWASDPEWLDTMHTLRADKKARFVGISINDHQPGNVIRALDTGLIDCVQVIYNIFDQSPEDELFPYCQKNGIGVIVRVPFDEGSLTGKIRPDTKFPDGDFRNVYFAGDRKQQVWERVQKIARETRTDVDHLPELALRFILRHPAVSTIIPGMRTTRHVTANARVSDEGPLDAQSRATLQQHRWVRSFYAEL
jgi:aryl-alcohol dehydrogenase-like predicted oxidoreductase